jgi:hypothetical protein
MRQAVAIGAAAMFAALGSLLQWYHGAYAAELGFDEASHYVSGLMIHDYVLHALGSSPIAYLVKWHGHYPLIGIGHWGPLYYALEAVWMLIFGTTRAAALGLSLAVAVSIGTIMVWYGFRSVGYATALLAGLAFMIAAPVQGAVTEAFLDLPVALLCLMATLAYAAWLTDSRWTHACGFALLSSAAMLVKGNGACLGLLPPLVVIISGRWNLLRCPIFWLPLPIVAVLVGPWYALTYDQVEAGFRYSSGWDYAWAAIPANSWSLLQAAGPLLLAAGVAGLVAVCMRRRERDPLVACLAALFAAVFLFQAVAPAAIQARYIIPALPPMLLLAAWLVNFLPRPMLGTAVFAVMLAAMLPWAAAVHEKPRLGIIAAAKAIRANVIPTNPAVLLATDGLAEVAAIAELAELDPARPSLFAVRGTRLLGAGGYNQRDYQPRFTSAREAMEAISASGIPLVFLRRRVDGNDWPHIDQVAEAAIAGGWQRIWQHQDKGYLNELFLIRENASRPADVAVLIRLSSPHRLGQ